MVWSTSARCTWPSLRATAEQELGQVGPSHLFQAELELSCMACRAAWNRGRSLRTGELMKRGRGLLNEPILWDWSAKDRAVVSPPFIGSGGAEQDHHKGSSLEGSRVRLSNIHESSSPRTQWKAKSQPWTSSSPPCWVVTWAAWRRNCSSPAMQRERRRVRQRREGWKYPVPLTLTEALARLWNSRVLQQPYFSSCPINNNPTETVRKASTLPLLTSISREARTEMPQLFCQRHFTNTFKYS